MIKNLVNTILSDNRQYPVYCTETITVLINSNGKSFLPDNSVLNNAVIHGISCSNRIGCGPDGRRLASSEIASRSHLRIQQGNSETHNAMPIDNLYYDKNCPATYMQMNIDNGINMEKSYITTVTKIDGEPDLVIPENVVIELTFYYLPPYDC